MKNNTFGKIALVLAVAGLFSAQANAGTIDKIDATLNSCGPNGASGAEIVNLSYDGSNPNDHTPFYGSVYAGALNWTTRTDHVSPYASPLDAQFSTYCVDIATEISLGGTYGYQISNGSSGTNGLTDLASVKYSSNTAATVEIGNLWAADFAYTTGTGVTTSYGTFSAADASAAFQIDIWKILYGGTAGTGLTASSYGGMALGEHWFADVTTSPTIKTSPASGGFYSLLGTADGAYSKGQDQAIAFSIPASSPMSPVPLPSSLAGGVAMSIVAGLLTLHRRGFTA